MFKKKDLFHYRQLVNTAEFPVFNLLAGHPLAYVCSTRQTLQAGSQMRAKPDLFPEDLLSPVHFARASGAFPYSCCTVQLFPRELGTNLPAWAHMGTWEQCKRIFSAKRLGWSSDNFCHKEDVL